MELNIAFDKDSHEEIFLYNEFSFEKKTCILDCFPKGGVAPIGSLLVEFLNTNIEEITGCMDFISKYCFLSYYSKHFPDKINPWRNTKIELSSFDFLKQLAIFAHRYRESFIQAKNVFLKNLNLPYDKNLLLDFEGADDRPLGEYLEEDSAENIEEVREVFKVMEQKIRTMGKYVYNHPEDFVYAENKYKAKNERNNLGEYLINTAEIGLLADDLRIDLLLTRYVFAQIPLFRHNIPFGFTSNDIICILAIEFREFISDAHNTIRKCHNCGKYFIPQNLKSTKYCDNIFENGKTCREIGKEASYKESLKNDALLDLYRKRYMSLASSNSHYHTEKTQKKFEKYKSEGAIMKEKYMKGEISKNEFKKWIQNSYR